MNRFAQILVTATFAFGLSGTALAQATPSAHQQHAGPAVAQPTASHQEQGPGHQQQGEHEQNCRCCCCRMMMEMMQRHGMHPPGAPTDQPDEHQ